MTSPKFALGLFCLLAAVPVFAQTSGDRFIGHEEAPYFVTLSPSRSRLVSTGFDESVRLWNTQSRSMIASFQEHQGIVLTASFNSDETLLASGGLDRSIRLWDVPQSEPTERFQIANFPVTAAASGREGEVLVAVSKDGQILIWNTATQEPLTSLKTTLANPQFVAVHQEGKSVAVANSDGEMEIFSGQDWKASTRVLAHREGLLQLVSSGVNYYFTLGKDNVLRRWPISPPATESWTSETSLTAANISLSGAYAATISQDQKLFLWNVAKQSIENEVADVKTTWSLPTFSDDSQWLVAIGEKRTPHIIQSSTAKLIRSLPAFSADVTALALSPNKQQLAVGFINGQTQIVNAETGELIEEIDSGKSRISKLAWHHTSQQFYFGNDAGEVQLRKIGSPDSIVKWSTSSGVTSLFTNSRKNRIAVGTQAGGLVILSADSLKVEQEYPQQPAAILSVDLGSNADQLISADASGTVTLWNTAKLVPNEFYSLGEQQILTSVRLGNGDCLSIGALGHFSQQKPVSNLTVLFEAPAVERFALSDNMNEVSVIGTDQSIRTINGNSGTVGKPYEGHSGTLTATAYAPGNNQFFVANEAGVIFEYRISNHQLQQVYGVGEPITGISVTRDSQRLLVSTRSGNVRCYAIRRVDANERIKLDITSPTLQELNFTNSAPLTVSVQDDHHTGWTLTAQGEAQQWTLAEAASVARLTGHGGQIYSVAFSPDGTRLVSVSSDKTVRLWDPIARKAIKTLATYDQVLYDVVFSSDGKSIFVCGADRLVRELDPESGQIKQSYEGSEETLYTIDVSADGQKICAAGTGLGPERDVLIWSRGNKEPLVSLSMKTDSIYTVEFDEAGEELFAIGYNGHIERFSISERKSTGVLDIPFVVYSGCLAPDEKSLILATDRKEILSYSLPK